MSTSTAVLVRDEVYYTTRLENYLSNLRNVCANEEMYQAALHAAKDRAEELELTLIEAVQLTAWEIATAARLQPTT